jgi:hypothetical protein
MKFLAAFIVALFSLMHVPAFAEAETKKVCVVDDKTKKETCKTIKVHKKAEKVTQGNPNDPEQKKKK